MSLLKDAHKICIGSSIIEKVFLGNSLVYTAGVLPLDTLPTPTLAFSLRKLRTAYNGNCIRVRRSSDNVEQDFGFINNYVDVTAITNFLNSSTGFIPVIYDQSGKGRNGTQAIATNQPRWGGNRILFLDTTNTALGNPEMWWEFTRHNIRSAFWQLEFNATANNWLLGDTITRPIPATNTTKYLSDGSPDVVNGLWLRNNIQINPLTEDKTLAKQTISMQMAGTASVTVARFSKDRNDANRSFKGDFYELITFSENLNAAQHTKLNNTLIGYYA